jgi:hypothetical protein
MVPTLERAELKSLNFTISYPHVRKGVAICPIQHDSIIGDYLLKFVPDFYGPEAEISGNSLEMDHRG